MNGQQQHPIRIEVLDRATFRAKYGPRVVGLHYVDEEGRHIVVLPRGASTKTRMHEIAHAELGHGFVRVCRKYTPGVLREEVIEAPTAKQAVESLEEGPVRFWYRGREHGEFVGQRYLYEVKEL